MGLLYRSDAAQERVQGWCRARLETFAEAHETMFIGTRAGPIHVLHAGSDPVTLVVYLPGTNFNAATSLSFIGSLTALGEVVVLDLPGQPGLSTPQRPTREDPSGRSWVSEVVTELRASDEQRVVLIGHSRGAADALSVAPSDADAVVLVNPAGLARVTITPRLLRSSLPWMLRPTAARSSALLSLMSAPGYQPSPEHVEWLTMVAQDTRTTGAPGPVPRAWTDRWRTRPAAVLTGEHDAFFPHRKIATAARDRLGIQATEVEGVGHLSVEEAPGSVASEISRFLRDRSLNKP